jgi:hypothetical protein
MRVQPPIWFIADALQPTKAFKKAYNKPAMDLTSLELRENHLLVETKLCVKLSHQWALSKVDEAQTMIVVPGGFFSSVCLWFKLCLLTCDASVTFRHCYPIPFCLTPLRSTLLVKNSKQVTINGCQSRELQKNPKYIPSANFQRPAPPRSLYTPNISSL